MTTEALVTRTYRAALRVGDDYITIEETIALPPDASDDDITQAVDTGLRIYRAQQTAIEAQMSAIREAHPAGPIRILEPDAPASEKQRSYLDYLATTLDWSNERLQQYVQEHGASYETLTKGQASEIIDTLKQQLDQRTSDTAPAPSVDQAELAVAEPVPTRTTPASPASTRQIAALQRVAAQHDIDLLAEARGRFGVAQLDELSSQEAGALLQELQRR